MIDFDSLHETVSKRVPPARISNFLVTVISFLIILVTFSTCVMCVTYVRRKIRKKQYNSNSLFCRSETSETLIESTLMTSDAPPTSYSAIDV